MTGHAGELRGLGGRQQALAWARDAHGGPAPACARPERAHGRTLGRGTNPTAGGEPAAGGVPRKGPKAGIAIAGTTRASPATEPMLRSISAEAINMALEMSPKYIRNLHLPDKAIGWLDTASVKVEINEPSEMIVRPEHIIDVISQESRIPKDMIYRDTSDRFSQMEIDLAGRGIEGVDGPEGVHHRVDHAVDPRDAELARDERGVEADGGRRGGERRFVRARLELSLIHI